MRYALSIFGITLGVAVYAAMIYADFSDEYRYGDYWIIQSGANIYLGFTAFLLSLFSTAFATWRLRTWITQVSLFVVSLIFGVIGYQLAKYVYHASWHPDKAQHWTLLVACIGIGFAFCFGFAILKNSFKANIQTEASEGQ